ncbi:hypothetical protein D9M72_526150 [compost metagenome]
MDADLALARSGARRANIAGGSGAVLLLVGVVHPEGASAGEALDQTGEEPGGTLPASAGHGVPVGAPGEEHFQFGGFVGADDRGPYLLRESVLAEERAAGAARVAGAAVGHVAEDRVASPQVGDRGGVPFSGLAGCNAFGVQSLGDSVAGSAGEDFVGHTADECGLFGVELQSAALA